MERTRLVKQITKTSRVLVVVVLLLGLGLGASWHPAVRAAAPGLPFREDFRDMALRGGSLTNANWSTAEQALLLASWRPQYGAFGPGLTGSDISADAHDTVSVALGDVDRDGDLDLVSGNDGQTNRLYRRVLYHTGQGQAGSLRVSTGTGNVDRAMLNPTAALPPHTRVTYWLSNNGGAQWFIVRPGAMFVFPTAGTDLRWRAELYSLSLPYTRRASSRSRSPNGTPFICRWPSNEWRTTMVAVRKNAGAPGVNHLGRFLFPVPETASSARLYR